MNIHDNRRTLLPRSLEGRDYQGIDNQQNKEPELEGIAEGSSSRKKSNFLRKKNTKLISSPTSPRTAANDDNLSPVSQSSRKLFISDEPVWRKYHQFLESDQAGKAIIAHDNTIDHNIVVVKKKKAEADGAQRKQFTKVITDRPRNLVLIQDVLIEQPWIYSVYESLETSLHHVQATSRQDITEIDLAIIGKEVLQGLHYIHIELGIAYGRLNARNLLLSFYTCNLKLANIADSILDASDASRSEDTRAVGQLLLGLKEPGTRRRNPGSLEFERQGDISDLCKVFVRSTDTSSVPVLLEV
ncbi:hypothetical protein BDV59DRAFT_186808 [Aspergillus ambiguus]|uniref:uncharacterized protein n=1 Tax=Aspergillus ambiguus TaxID=176160 RepID=UPI003CCDDD5C